MCKIDLPRKNMVIERERARGRGGGEAAGNQHTLAQITRAQRHTLKRWKEYRGKSAGLGGMKKKKLSLYCSLVLLPIKKNEVHQQ